MGVLLLATGGGVCASALSSVVDVLFVQVDAATTADLAAQFDIPVFSADPRKAAELFNQGSMLTYAAIGVSLASILSKEALFRITL